MNLTCERLRPPDLQQVLGTRNDARVVTSTIGRRLLPPEVAFVWPHCTNHGVSDPAPRACIEPGRENAGSLTPWFVCPCTCIVHPRWRARTGRPADRHVHREPASDVASTRGSSSHVRPSRRGVWRCARRCQCSSLRSTAQARPSGIDNACAQRHCWQLRDGRQWAQLHTEVIV